MSDQGKKALVIEDDPFILDLLVHKLKIQKWDVYSAFTGELGLKSARENTPDVILLDILLPGMNGYEVLKQLKEDPALAHIPVLVLSNYGQDDEIEKSRELGAVDHLVKVHISLDEVVSKIDALTQGGEQA